VPRRGPEEKDRKTDFTKQNEYLTTQSKNCICPDGACTGLLTPEILHATTQGIITTLNPTAISHLILKTLSPSSTESFPLYTNTILQNLLLYSITVTLFHDIW